ncbi:hypothetical protein N8940_00795 [Sphingomonadaceae bacterium]|nr:hypothetical protein [Sphingomonadaceae bacterium]
MPAAAAQLDIIIVPAEIMNRFDNFGAHGRSARTLGERWQMPGADKAVDCKETGRLTARELASLRKQLKLIRSRGPGISRSIPEAAYSKVLCALAELTRLREEYVTIKRMALGPPDKAASDPESASN